MNEYEFILAVSSLEHIESETVFEKVVQHMACGNKYGGINGHIPHSEVAEIDIKTNPITFVIQKMKSRFFYRKAKAPV